MSNKPSGKCIKRAECPECSSSDGVQIFEHPDGKKDAFCFACETPFPEVEGLKVAKAVKVTTNTKPRIKMEDVRSLQGVEDRGIRKDIVDLFGVKMGFKSSDPTTIAHHFYPSHDLEGTLQGYDHRIVDPKDFNRVGSVKNSQLFGQNFCRSNKYLFVTEGHLDAMSLYQCLFDSMTPALQAKGYTPSVVSITNGVSGAVSQLTANSKFLSKFKEIILVFDNDSAGKNGAEKVAKSLDFKILITDLPMKDANEMIIADRGRELRDCVFNAVPYEPDGIINANDAWDRYKTKKDTKCYPYPKQFEELNEKTYGYRLGNVITVTSGCVDYDTEYLSERGWKKIGEYTGGRVAQVDGGSIMFTRPLQYIKAPCSDAYHIKTKYGIDMVLTPEHNVVSYKMTGEEVHRPLSEVMGIHSKNTTGFRERIKTTFDIPIRPSVLDVDLVETRCLVMFAADGHQHGRKVVIKLKKPRKIKRARELLGVSNYEYTSKVNEETGYTTFSVCEATKLGLYNLRFTLLSNDEARVVYEESLMWDGNCKNTFYTTVKEQADYFQYCASSCGHRASLSTYDRTAEGKPIEYRVHCTANAFTSFRKTLTSTPEFIPFKMDTKYCFTVMSGKLLLRRGGNIFVTGNSGMGKTQFLRELKYDILKTTDFKIADIALEEDIGDTVEGLMALELNKRIHLPDVKVSEEEEAKAFKTLFGEGRVELYDHFGGMSDSSLFSRMRYFATYLKCKVMVLDHLSIVISETADEGDERRRIDAVMTKLAVMAKSLDIVIFLVVHLRKAGQGKSFEEGYVPTSDDLRGSAAIKQLSSDIIALSRNQQEKDEVKRNTSGLHVLKCRFSGDTGQAGYSFFDPLTGRMVRGEDPTIETIDEESEF